MKHSEFKTLADHKKSICRELVRWLWDNNKEFYRGCKKQNLFIVLPLHLKCYERVNDIRIIYLDNEYYHKYLHPFVTKDGDICFQIHLLYLLEYQLTEDLFSKEEREYYNYKVTYAMNCAIISQTKPFHLILDNGFLENKDEI